MPYRLPFELELAILDLAAAPLAFDRLHDRVAFFINVSLVHRSFTAWAQDRLRNQFLYTYQPRPDEHERLKKRFEAGFGPDRLLRRFYLDLTRLPADISDRTEPGIDSVFTTFDVPANEAVSDLRVPADSEAAGTSIPGQVCDAVAHFAQFGDNPTSEYGDYWVLCDMISHHCQPLDTLWLLPQSLKLNLLDLPSIPVLYIDNGAFDSAWGGFDMIPPVSTTVLRKIGLHVDDDSDELSELSARQLVFDKCWVDDAGPDEVLERCPYIETVDLDDVGIPYPAPDARLVLPQLESFTFTLLPDKDCPRSAEDDAEALGDLKQAVNLLIDAPRCSFRYLRSTKSPEDELADAMADFGL